MLFYAIKAVISKCLNNDEAITVNMFSFTENNKYNNNLS